MAQHQNKELLKQTLCIQFAAIEKGVMDNAAALAKAQANFVITVWQTFC
jgi:hypothetical protein